MPKRCALALFVAVLLVAGGAVPAAAEYYYTKRGAENVTLDAVKKRYGYSRYESAASCRPQGQNRDNPSFKYHRWVCGWATPAKGRCDGGEAFIYGNMLIVGRSTPGGYSYQVTRGAYCDD